MPRVLVVDDDAAVREALVEVLEYEQYDVDQAGDGDEALVRLKGGDYDLVLLDVKMPGRDGLEVLEEFRESGDSTPVVMISGHGDVATAVEATRLGAFDFLEKPIGRDRLLVVARNARQAGILADENRELRERIGADRMVGSSRVMEELRATIARVAPTSATVLVVGPSGAGKELVARAIHENSKVAKGPFVRVNCAAIPDELIESELFGHEKGSFTGASRRQAGKFAVADGGTLMLDEVGDLSLRAQAKVLRALADGEIEPVGASRIVNVDVRVVAATNKDLGAAIAAGEFREDLFYRLNVVPLEVPPLSDRPADIPELVEHFAARTAAEIGRNPPRFSGAALDRMAAWHWPGNVRELANVVERMLILHDADPLGPAELPAELTGGSERGLVSVDETLTLAEFKERAEREFIHQRLLANGWNVSATAESLSTPRSNLYKKIEQYELKRGDGE